MFVITIYYLKMEFINHKARNQKFVDEIELLI